MNSAEEILKKILLNMKYDSRKTLNENRSLLKEDEKCIPMDTEIVGRESGQLRNPKYPELGSTGDGNCLCKNEKCLRYDKSCCTSSKVKIDVGQLEKVGTAEEGTVEIRGVDYKGDSLILPAGAKVGVKYTNFEYDEYKVNYDAAVKRFPKMITYCELAQLELKSCVLNAVNNLLEGIPNNAIMTFTVDGLPYHACYQKIRETPDLGFKWMGYFGATADERESVEQGKCVGIPWEKKVEGETDPNTGKTLTGTEDSKTKKESDYYKTGDEVLLPLIK